MKKADTGLLGFLFELWLALFAGLMVLIGGPLYLIFGEGDYQYILLIIIGISIIIGFYMAYKKAGG